MFFGSGGYAVALAAHDWHVAGGWAVFALLPFGGMVAGLIAIPVGLVALRTRRHTFVVVTIAIFFIFQLAAINLGFTGGTSGHPAADRPVLGRQLQPAVLLRRARDPGADDRALRGRCAARGSACSCWRSATTRTARSASACKTRRVKLVAFVLSAIPVGMVGGLYFYFLGQIFPQFAFDPLFDISIALMAFLGGIGTIVGPLLGALVLESLQQYLTQTFSGSGDLPDRLRRAVPRRDPAAAARRRPEHRRARRATGARGRPDDAMPRPSAGSRGVAGAAR